MGQLDNVPSSPYPGDRAAQDILRSVTQDLKTLQHDLAAQLTQDITRLQTTKQRLLDDIEILEEEYRDLQGKYDALRASQEVELSRQQLAQQQLWAKRLAQALATHLQGRLTEAIYGGIAMNGDRQPTSLNNAYQLLSSLDATLNDTLHALQQDLNSYHSSLSQQISRMHSMEQQGEAILEALVNRLNQHLQTQVMRPTAALAGDPRYGGQQNGYPAAIAGNGSQSTSLPASRSGQSPTATPRPELPEAQRSPKPKAIPDNPAALFKTGLVFIICSTLALSVHNVLVGIIGYGGNIFGQLAIPGIFPLNIPNSLMLLWLRMLVVLPLMAIVAGKLYPATWKDIRHFLGAEDKRPIFQVIASGGFLFMSQVLIYKSISEVGPGVAVTLLFMYPLITVPLAWFLFGDRPTSLRAVVMFAITIGVVLTALPRISADLAGVGGAVSPWGILAALLSSGTFALYLISMQLSFRKLHPVPVSLCQFTTIFVLTSVVLIVGSFFGLQTAEPSSYGGLYLGGVLLGGLTLLGYLFNNYGVRFMGAAQASIVAATGPVLTAIMAYLITPGEKSMLQFIQWIGVTLVTLGVLALSLERLNLEAKPKPKRVR